MQLVNATIHCTRCTSDRPVDVVERACLTLALVCQGSATPLAYAPAGYRQGTSTCMMTTEIG